MNTVAICGNPNSGKTTLFNALTGSHQQVGNWPGVTVEKKVGKFKAAEKTISIVDLPGTYSLTANSIDERIARDFIIKENPDAVIVVVDQTNLERNLYLVLEILEMKKKVVLAFNMSDETQRRGISINTENLAKELGVKIVKTSASKKEGLNELKQAIIQTLETGKETQLFSYSEKFMKYLSQTEEILKKHHSDNFVDYGWTALKILEGDTEIKDSVSQETMQDIDKLTASMSQEFKEDPSIIVSEEKYKFISSLSKKYVTRKKVNESWSDKVDKVVTNKWLGIPIFLLVMWLTFTLTFTIGDIFNGMLDEGFVALGEWAGAKLGEGMLSSFIVNGIIGGVGSVVVFLPNIFLLFLFISFLGDVGYMPRAAFVMDKLMTKIGLHGKSFIPMILGFGCSIPAIMSTRTLESKRDRIVTILVNPFMSCAARLPVYTLVAGIFFPQNAGFVIFTLYVLGILISIISALIFKKTLFKNEESVFIMELPPYRLPSIKSILSEAGMRAFMFLKKAGTVIFAAVIVIWLLASLPAGVEYAGEESIIGIFGKIISPIFKPLGFGFWQASVSLFFGFLAKEVVTGTMGTLFGGEEILSQVLPQFFNSVSAYAFLVFTLLYTPCVATIGTIKQEIGAKWALFSVIYSFAAAYVVSFIVFTIGSIIF